jgi:transcription elongation factor Elf1
MQLGIESREAGSEQVNEAIMSEPAHLGVNCPRCGQESSVDLTELNKEPDATLRCTSCGADYPQAEAVRSALLNAARKDP